MNRITLSVVTAVASLGLAGAAFAADGSKVTFEQLDKDGTGYIERQDIPADHELARLFDMYDLDRDNRLSLTEFQNYSGDSETEEAEE